MSAATTSSPVAPDDEDNVGTRKKRRETKRETENNTARPELWPNTLRGGNREERNAYEDFKRKTMGHQSSTIQMMNRADRFCVQYFVELLDKEGRPGKINFKIIRKAMVG